MITLSLHQVLLLCAALLVYVVGVACFTWGKIRGKAQGYEKAKAEFNAQEFALPNATIVHKINDDATATLTIQNQPGERTFLMTVHYSAAKVRQAFNYYAGVRRLLDEKP